MIAIDFMFYINNHLKGTEAASHLTWLEQGCRTQGAEITEEQALPHSSPIYCGRVATSVCIGTHGIISHLWLQAGLVKGFKKHEETTLFLSQNEPQPNSSAAVCLSYSGHVWMEEEDFGYFSGCLVSWLECMSTKHNQVDSKCRHSKLDIPRSWIYGT